MILRLNSGNGHDRNDIFNAAAAGQVVDRITEALADRADCLGARQTLHKLVADVARLKIREYQNVGFARNRAAGRLELADLFNGLMMMINLAAILILSKEAVPYAKALKKKAERNK